MNATHDARDAQQGSEGLQAAIRSRKRPETARSSGKSDLAGSHVISSVVLPLLEREKVRFHEQGVRLDYGIRKFDIVTGESWSVYIRVVNPSSHKGSEYIIVDLSSKRPLIIATNSLDIGSTVRRRELQELSITGHDQVTESLIQELVQNMAETVNS